MTLLLESDELRTESDRPAITSTSSSGVDVLQLDHHDRLVQALLRVGQLRSLEEDWNSYGSPPPSERLIQVVEAFIESSDHFFRPFLPAPHTVPVPGGGIKLAWLNGERELELELGPIEDGHMPIEYLRVSHGEPIAEGPVGGTALVEHLTWVIRG
jgi:hypothetical protein